MLDLLLSSLPKKFQSSRVGVDALAEAKNRVLDSLGCFYGAFNAKPGRTIRETLIKNVSGECVLWGTTRRVPAELAAWANGTCIRTLDYNDTYLSLEPCHPSDLIPSLWAACELNDSRDQGNELLRALILAYEVVCRLCDAGSIRKRGWDHVTYLPIASAVGCCYLFKLSPEQTRHAIALAMVGNNAMRQTRVGTISDWKAACAAYAARSGLWAARLAQVGFTGPSDIFSGRNGFSAQVSGPLKFSMNGWSKPWMILKTHVKFFPAEHHAQSAIEAALQIRRNSFPHQSVAEIKIETFDVAAEIIGSEKEKWIPKTRETADHSMPYLVAVALLDGDVNLPQYENKRYADKDVLSLLRKTTVVQSKRYSSIYPESLPNRVTVKLKNGRVYWAEVLKPKGYAGRPMNQREIIQKFNRLSAAHLSDRRRAALSGWVLNMERVTKLAGLAGIMEIE